MVCELVSPGVPPPQQRSRKRIWPLPFGLSTAIQYDVPLATGVASTAMSFQAPAVGEFSVPCASSAPGWPAVSP